MTKYYVIERNDKHLRKQHLIVHTRDSIGQAKKMTRRTTSDFTTRECIIAPVDQLNGKRVIGFILLDKETYKPLCGRHAKGVPFLGGEDDAPRGYYTANGAVTGAMRYMKTIFPGRVHVGHDFIVHGLVVFDSGGGSVGIQSRRITAVKGTPLEMPERPETSSIQVTKSPGLHVQQSGRAKRPEPLGKTPPMPMVPGMKDTL